MDWFENEKLWYNTRCIRIIIQYSAIIHQELLSFSLHMRDQVKKYE